LWNASVGPTSILRIAQGDDHIVDRGTQSYPLIVIAVSDLRLHFLAKCQQLPPRETNRDQAIATPVHDLLELFKCGVELSLVGHPAVPTLLSGGSREPSSRPS
jgi:hypothetical protein